MEYSIVMSAYNESARILTTLNQVIEFMRSLGTSFEFIVVDDGSLDNTAEIVENYARENPEVVLIKNPHRGKGHGIWTGINRASGNMIYTIDTDLSTSIDELKRLSVWIKDQDFDIVIASREGFGARRVGEPFYRHLMGRAFNFIVQSLVLPGIKDSQCGFKLFTKKSAKAIFSRLKIYGSEQKDLTEAYLGAWDVEALFIARKLGYKIKEIPVTWTFVKTTRLRPFKDSIKMALDVLKVRINDIKGLYNI